MALDVGSKRIGIAVADPSESFALPVGTVERSNKRNDLAQLREYFDSYGVHELVVGDPLTLSGERGVAAHAMDGSLRNSAPSSPELSIAFDERLYYGAGNQDARGRRRQPPQTPPSRR